MSSEEQKDGQPVRPVWTPGFVPQDSDEEWEALDAEADAQEQAVLEEIAAARVARAKIEQKAQKRQEAEEARAAEEAERAEKEAKAAAVDEELTDEERLHRKAVRLAKKGVRLRRNFKITLAFAAIGLVYLVIGITSGNVLRMAIGAILAIAAGALAFKIRGDFTSTEASYKVAHAEYDEYMAAHPKTEEPAE